MKNGRTGSNYVEPPDDSRMEGYKTDRTDAGSMCCTGMQNDDLKDGNTELSDITAVLGIAGIIFSMLPDGNTGLSCEAVARQ